MLMFLQICLQVQILKNHSQEHRQEDLIQFGV